MTSSNEKLDYDEMLSSILVKENNLLGFLSAVFNFLARRTDFYYVPKSIDENLGFLPGVAEQLVLKVMRSCDPKNPSSSDINNEIMCSTVAQEVEVVSEEDMKDRPVNDNLHSEIKAIDISDLNNKGSKASSSNYEEPPLEPDDYKPPDRPVQKNSEAYNGAVRENYSWAQTIMELDITVKLPPDVKSSKDLKITINPGDLTVLKRNGDVIIKDTLPYKIKASESFWTISEGKLLIHLEKNNERWWTKLLNGEEEIDLDIIDCSRPMHELPDDHIAKIQELQWNQRQKQQGLPTSDEIKKIEILKKAWDKDGSPFKGQKFDPSLIQ